MNKQVHHYAYVERPFGALCDDLDRRGPQLVETATRSAAAFAADLADYLESRLGFFDKDERVNVRVGELDRQARHATLKVIWEADQTKRLLPNVEAALHLVPIISTGRGATSELSLRGTYTTPHVRHGGVVEHALTRRLVDATLHTFVRHLADALGSPESSSDRGRPT